MSTSVFYVIQVVSTFSILPAILLGVLSLKRLPRPGLLFWFFCLFGFIIDLLGWYFYNTGNADANQVARHSYIVAECSFYFWFVGCELENKKAKFIFTWAWVVIAPLLIFAVSPTDAPRFSILFQVVISFALSYCLLRRVERDSNVYRQFMFWLFLGSFVYYFCTYFFMNLMYTQFGINLWYIRNIISIITNLIFAWGFFIQYGSTR